MDGDLAFHAQDAGTYDIYVQPAGTGWQEVFVMNADGSGVRQLT